MKRVLPLALLLPLLAVAPTSLPTAAAAGAPLAISVGGDGIAMFPRFAPGTSRYAVTGVDGSLTVTAAGGAVRVDGRPVPSGTTTLTGLEPGDEVSVLVDDAPYALFVTPPGFPTLERTTPDASVAAMQPGQTLLTLGLFTAPSPFYETAVDANGVPVFAHEEASASNDLKLQPDGHYSVARASSTPGAGWDIVELGADLQPIGTYRMVGVPNTDSHDALFLPGGDHVLMGYEPNADTGLVDAVIQEIDREGNVLFQWSSAPYADESTAPTGTADYAHVNSMSLTTDGDLLVSFRHFSSVWKIALTARRGVAVGDVVWRLGGRDSDFTFTGSPADGTDGGPCAQHTATMLPDGHVLVWDNGSWDASTAYCVSGTDPSGPAVQRPHTRVAEWALDEQTHTADLVFSYDEPDRFAIFAGSAYRQPNGDTVLGWAADRSSVAGEVSPDGTLLWNLRDTAATASDRQITYRAARAVVADWAAPVVEVESPGRGLVVDQGDVQTAAFGCTDVGGSTLRTCDGSVGGGERLDTSTPGRHTFEVTATDGAGHRTTVRRTYTVRAASRPRVDVRTPGRSWTGSGPVTVRDGGACTAVRLTNDGVRPDRLRLAAVPPAHHWRVTWRVAGDDVTRKVAGGRYVVRLAPGVARTLCLRVARTDRHRTAPALDLRVEGAGASDRIRLRLR